MGPAGATICFGIEEFGRCLAIWRTTIKFKFRMSAIACDAVLVSVWLPPLKNAYRLIRQSSPHIGCVRVAVSSHNWNRSYCGGTDAHTRHVPVDSNLVGHR